MNLIGACLLTLQVRFKIILNVVRMRLDVIVWLERVQLVDLFRRVKSKLPQGLVVKIGLNYFKIPPDFYLLLALHYPLKVVLS